MWHSLHHKVQGKFRQFYRLLNFGVAWLQIISGITECCCVRCQYLSGISQLFKILINLNTLFEKDCKKMRFRENSFIQSQKRFQGFLHCLLAMIDCGVSQWGVITEKSLSGADIMYGFYEPLTDFMLYYVIHEEPFHFQQLCAQAMF